MIIQSQISFGEIDAKHEVFVQNRMGQDIFFRSYIIPPGLDEFQLVQGARFFIVGQKGSGKTALMLYLREKYRRSGSLTETVLFKSDLNEDERQRLIQGKDISVIEAIEAARSGFDYKSNWLWYIIVHLSYLIKPDMLLSGHDYLHDLRVLTGAAVRPKQSLFTGLRLNKIKGDITAQINAGVFKTSVKADVEAIANNSDRPEIDVIESAERCLSSLNLHPAKRVALFFDELELFNSQSDQKNRDLFLIRDLLYSVARVNRRVGHSSASIVVYASVRSEILDEINLVSEEINKEIDDFGVRVDWDTKSRSDSQPIIQIISDKINASEVEEGEHQTSDVWDSYFPNRLFGKDSRQYLLDISMFRPRNIIRRLNAAKRSPDEAIFSIGDFEDSQLEFSAGVWKEIEDELRAVYKPEIVRAIKSFLSGYKSRFSISQLESRIHGSLHVTSHIRNKFGTKAEVTRLLEVLYRSGAIGNSYELQGPSKSQSRDRWSFRGYSEPLYDRDFVVHESIRKALQLSFD